MELQTTVRPVSTRPLVLLVALVAAVALALVAWHALASQGPASVAGQRTTFHLQSIGAQQVAHNRSEEGLGSASTGSELVGHNRSEEGLTNP